MRHQVHHRARFVLLHDPSPIQPASNNWVSTTTTTLPREAFSRLRLTSRKISPVVHRDAAGCVTADAAKTIRPDLWELPYLKNLDHQTTFNSSRFVSNSAARTQETAPSNVCVNNLLTADRIPDTWERGSVFRRRSVMTAPMEANGTSRAVPKVYCTMWFKATCSATDGG